MGLAVDIIVWDMVVEKEVENLREIKCLFSKMEVVSEMNPEKAR